MKRAPSRPGAPARATPRRPTRDGGIDQTCPRCGITVHVRSPAMAVRYCPHCMARARIATPMPMSGPPAR
jgi:hypothetical protein